MILAAAVVLAIATSRLDDPRSLAAGAIDAANEWKLDEADALARKAYAIASGCGDLAAQSLAVDASAVVARLRGDRERAIAESNLSLALAELASDSLAAARAHNNLGRIAAELTGDFGEAAERYRLALVLATSSADVALRVRVLNNLGNLDRMRSRRQSALESFRTALQLTERTNDVTGRIAVQHNIGLVYLEQNDPQRALPHLQQALELEQRAGSAAAARTLLSIAETYRALGDETRAGSYLQQANDVASSRGDEAARASILLRRADLAMNGERFTQAERDVALSRTISERLGDRAMLPLIHAYAAKLALARGRLDASRKEAARAVAGAADLRQFDVVAQAHSIAGIAALRDGDRTAARIAFDRAIRAVEQQRLTLAGGPLARQRFFGRELFPYEQIIAITAGQGDAAATLRYAEMKRARVVSEASSRATPRALKPAGSGTAIVSYAMTDTRVVAIIDDGTGLRVVTLPLSRDAIATRVRHFAGQIAQRDNGFLSSARELYDILWLPLALSGRTRVRVLPDEELWHVPFAALVDPTGRFLIETVVLSYAPAVSALGEERGLQPRSVLLAANLPAHPTEIQALADIYKDLEVTVIDSAAETAVKRGMARNDIVHIAAHGVFDDREPLDSHLKLRADAREDGRLTARELMETPVSASILVLSSCDSASGTVAAGEGIISMTWAALVAGCPTVVASQWQVASQTTTEIMSAFHRELRRGGSVAASLRTAQLSASRATASAHPYYWAAFVVVGR